MEVPLQDASAGISKVIAHLSEWVSTDSPEYIDAAIAELVAAGEVDPAIEEIGSIVNPPVAAALGQRVQKHGRTTSRTVGVIVDLSFDRPVRVEYSPATVPLKDLLGIDGVDRDFAAHGDSGALIADAGRRNPIGLLVAVGSLRGMAFAHRIGPVLDRLGVAIIE